MIILLLSFLSVFIFLEIRFSIIDMLFPVSYFLHQECLARIPLESRYADSLSALVCGKNFSSFQDSYLYVASGLIHLFVVSGSHLLVFKKIVDHITKIFLKNESSILTIFILFIYCAICQFNPPVVRSFCYIALGTWLASTYRNWPTDYTLLLASLLTLCLKPEWINSLSFQMSWLAALVLHIYQLKLQNYPTLLRQILFYLVFIFCFNALGFPAFSITILCLILTPVLEYILFPSALLSTLFHGFEPLFALLIDVLNTLLSSLNYATTPSNFDLNDVKYLNWLIIFCGHFFLFFKSKKS